MKSIDCVMRQRNQRETQAEVPLLLRYLLRYFEMHLLGKFSPDCDQFEATKVSLDYSCVWSSSDYVSCLQLTSKCRCKPCRELLLNPVLGARRIGLRRHSTKAAMLLNKRSLYCRSRMWHGFVLQCMALPITLPEIVEPGNHKRS